MRTDRAPTTALSGKNISDDSLAISMAILAAPYAVLQPDSFDDPGSSAPVPEGSNGGKPVDKAISLDEAASGFGSLALERALTTSFSFMNSIDGVEVDNWLFIGVADDEGFFRRWCMADDTKDGTV